MLPLSTLQRRFEVEAARSLQLAAANPRLGVPQAFIESKNGGYRIELLVPLTLTLDLGVNGNSHSNGNSFRFALALRPHHQHQLYEGMSILTLEMGYANARLVGAIDSSWLKLPQSPSTFTHTPSNNGSGPMATFGSGHCKCCRHRIDDHRPNQSNHGNHRPPGLHSPQHDRRQRHHQSMGHQSRSSGHHNQGNAHWNASSSAGPHNLSHNANGNRRRQSEQDNVQNVNNGMNAMNQMNQMNQSERDRNNGVNAVNLLLCVVSKVVDEGSLTSNGCISAL